MEPKTLVGLLAEPARLHVFAAVVLGARSPGEIAARTALPGRDVVVAVTRLTEGGLLATVEGKHRSPVDQGVMASQIG